MSRKRGELLCEVCVEIDDGIVKQAFGYSSLRHMHLDCCRLDFDEMMHACGVIKHGSQLLQCIGVFSGVSWMLLCGWPRKL